MLGGGPTRGGGTSNNNTPPSGAKDKGPETHSTSRQCSQCDRRAPCHLHSQEQHLQSETPPAPAGGSQQQTQQQQQQQQHGQGTTRPRRISKLKHRALNPAVAAVLGQPYFFPTANLSSSSYDDPAPNPNNRQPMEPPVLSFYGTEPVPLPSRFASIKRSLVAGHEAELEASWARLLAALRDEVAHIESLGPSLTPSIDFADLDDADKTGPFAAALRRYGVGVVRAAMPRADTQRAIDETVKYLETKHDFKPPPPQDPTCFDFFWSPAQVIARAHPNVLRTQRFAMGLWDNSEDDRMAVQFPITYADRIRIHGAGLGEAMPEAEEEGKPGEAKAPKTALETAQEARKVAVELLGDFSSSTVIAQVDNGSLERWEPDGYGRGGTYDAVFRGEWEKYDPWDPTFRCTATSDLYNGFGVCSIFRMYQGILALNTVEPGMVRLLPSPRLATAYFLLRPFFSPKTKPPEEREGPEWDAFLDVSNWVLDKDQSTIIHGAVPGHAQRLTELWHPHLHLRRTLVTLPTLHAGDYILWHPDLAYHFTSTGGFGPSRAATPPPDDVSHPQVSMLVYVGACPLTQTNALYLARQRKTFQRGHPGPDFDASGSGLGSEATHAGRPGEKEIEQAGGNAALQAMGLAPFAVPSTPSAPSSASSTAGEPKDGDDVAMMDADASSRPVSRAQDSSLPCSEAAAEVARLANIILFPDRYDFYMPSGKKAAKAVKK
ncbi:hypothetical protein GQ53DRAFT_660174 [Thozetella sp. PMI_491]|nr:hypothetical protein GQ53DRAFT_660174 [Thozetella sp. PMI_491]